MTRLWPRRRRHRRPPSSYGIVRRAAPPAFLGVRPVHRRRPLLLDATYAKNDCSVVDAVRRGRGARGPRRIGWFGLQGRAILRGGGQGVAGEGREGERMPLFCQQRLQYDEKGIGSD